MALVPSFELMLALAVLLGLVGGGSLTLCYTIGGLMVPHEVRTVTDELAYETKRDLARREGLLVGISSGANVAVALEVARELGEGKNVVTVLCDTGERYFSLDEYFSK